MRYLFLALFLLCGSVSYSQYVSSAYNSGAGAGGTWTLTQNPTGVASSGGTCVISTGSNVTLGNLLVASGLIGASATLTIADNHGNTWTQVQKNGFVGMWFLIAPSTQSMIVTITFTGSGAGNACVLQEWNGNKASSPLDTSGIATASEAGGAVSVTTAGNLTANSDLLLGWIFGDNGGISSTSNGAGFTAPAVNHFNNYGMQEYQVLTTGSGATASATWTTTGTESNYKIVAAFLHS